MLKKLTIFSLIAISSTGFANENLCSHYDRSFVAITDIVGSEVNADCQVGLYLEKSKSDTIDPYYDKPDSNLKIQQGTKLEVPSVPWHVSMSSNTVASQGIKSCSNANGDVRSLHDTVLDVGFEEHGYRISSVLRGLDVSGKSTLVIFYCTKNIKQVPWYDFNKKSEQEIQINKLKSLYKKSFESLFFDKSSKFFQIISPTNY